MTCRAPANPFVCTGTPTGAQLAYDNEGRLASWQNTPTSPTTTASDLYDGAGNRVQQAVTVNGSITTTTTYVAGGLEEVVSNGTSTTLTKYFTAGGVPAMERVATGGPLSVLASDGQGTVAESFDSAGNVTSAQLYTPMASRPLNLPPKPAPYTDDTERQRATEGGYGSARNPRPATCAERG